jgi:hypothetical protein
MAVTGAGNEQRRASAENPSHPLTLRSLPSQ